MSAAVPIPLQRLPLQKRAQVAGDDEFGGEARENVRGHRCIPVIEGQVYLPQGFVIADRLEVNRTVGVLEADDDESGVASFRVFLVGDVHVTGYEVTLVDEFLHPRAEQFPAAAWRRFRQSVVIHAKKLSS